MTAHPPFGTTPADLGESATAEVPSPLPAGTPGPRSDRPHLVVVYTRPPASTDAASPDDLLITRFWHPRDRRWSENSFESLEHALRLFVDESGWILLQQQPLDGAAAHELVFEARREDFTGPTTEEILQDVGIAPG